jgi:hypothetical protein
MYVPNDPNTVTIVVIDHIGLLKTTKIPTKLLTRCQMNLDMLEILWFYTSSSTV